MFSMKIDHNKREIFQQTGINLHTKRRIYFSVSRISDQSEHEKIIQSFNVLRIYVQKSFPYLLRDQALSCSTYTKFHP